MDRLTISMTHETKARMTEASGRLLMNRSEFVEYLMYKWSKGLVILVEEGAFLDGMMKAMDERAEKAGARAGEKAALLAMYDRGLIDSPLPR